VVYCKLILGRCYIIQRVFSNTKKCNDNKRKENKGKNRKSARVYEGKEKKNKICTGNGKMKKYRRRDGQKWKEREAE